MLLKLGEAHYGMPVLYVAEVHRLMPVTPFPGAPACVEGIADFRNTVIPVIDLRRRFGLPAAAPSPEARMIVACIDELRVGLIADAVTEVIVIDQQLIDPPPPITRPEDRKFIQGVARLEDRLVVLLDVAKMLSAAELEAMASVVADAGDAAEHDTSTAETA